MLVILKYFDREQMFLLTVCASNRMEYPLFSFLYDIMTPKCSSSDSRHHLMSN